MNKKIYIIEPTPQFSAILIDLKESLKTKGMELTQKLVDADWVVFLSCKENQATTGENSVEELIKLKKKVIVVKLDNSDVVPSLFRSQRIILYKDGQINKEELKKLPNNIIDIVTGKKGDNTLKLGQKLVFISYGHDKYGESLVNRIQNDLNESNLFKPWIDSVCLYGSLDWELEIMKGIENSSNVVLFMTDYSMRRPDGYCLKEVSYSFEKNKQIIPIRIEKTFTPLSIINIPKIDFSNCVDKDNKIIEKTYQENFQNLLLVLKDITQLAKFDADNVILRSKLKLNENYSIIDNASKIHDTKDFVGREWLLDKYNQWIKDENSRVLCILGNAGSGKSAFISNLVTMQPNVKAVHFCNYSNSETADPRNIIISLAFQLASQIQQYQENLLAQCALDGDNWIKNQDIEQLFDYLIIRPLSSIKLETTNSTNLQTGKEETINNQIVVLVIDGIDEAMKNSFQQKELLTTIVKKFRKGCSPDWLKLIITSRPLAIVKADLAIYNPITIEENQNNQNDIQKYLKKYLYEYIKDFSQKKQNYTINVIHKKSENNFLYISQVMEGLREKSYDIEHPEDFPTGLNGFYGNWFSKRLFNKDAKYDYQTDILPILKVVLSSFEPIDNNELSNILKIDRDELRNKCKYIELYFPKINNCLQPYHKSLVDWITDEANCPDYFVDTLSGHEKLSDYLFNKYQNNNSDDYTIKHIGSHCIKANHYEKAVKVLSDSNIQEQRIQLIGKDMALTQYFNEIKDLFNSNKLKAIEVMKSLGFLTIFAKYRKYLFTTDLYIILKSAGFDEVWKTINFKEKENIAITAGIINFLYKNNQYTDAIDVVPFSWEEINSKMNVNLLPNILKNNKSKQEIETIQKNYLNIVLEIVNKIGLICWKLQHVDQAMQFFNTVIAKLDDEWNNNDSQECLINPDFEEVSLAYEKLGDIYYHLQENETGFRHYQEGIRYLDKYQKSIKEEDRGLCRDVDIRKENLIVEICLHRIMSANPKDIDYVKKHLPFSIRTFKEFKVKDSRYIKTLYLDLLFHIHMHDYQYVYSQYNDAITLAKNNGVEYDIVCIEFALALACYLDNKIDEAKQHIELAKKTIKPWNLVLANELNVLKMKIFNTPKDQEMINKIKNKELTWLGKGGMTIVISGLLVNSIGPASKLSSWYQYFVNWIEYLKLK